jgi:hypothetical protein
MWIVLLLCLLLCLALGLFVIAPLVSTNETLQATALKGFTDENELRQALALRDALLEKCAYGTTGEPAVDTLREPEALEALVSLCERLRNAELPYLPARITRTVGLVLALWTCWGALGAQPEVAFAQAQAPEANDTSSTQARIPPPVSAEGGTLFATLHQFVISPREGKLHGYYLGLFNNADGLTEAKIALPLPRGFEELKILNLPQGVLEASGRSWPVVRTPVNPGVVEVRAEFILDATWGSAVWENADIPPLPGTLLILMPEYDSALRNLTENMFPSLNLWPPRVTNAPADFRSLRQQEEYNPEDPNYALLVKMPPAFTRNLIRTSAQPAAYPHFEVVGLMPTRMPLYVLGALFGTCLLGAGAYAVSRGNATKTAAQASLSKA